MDLVVRLFCVHTRPSCSRSDWQCSIGYFVLMQSGAVLTPHLFHVPVLVEKRQVAAVSTVV